MEINFTGKTALVTGAGKGIGRETAKLLAKCGANIIALTRTQSDLDSLKKEIPNLQTICVDLVNVDDAMQAVDAAGHIDFLVNNAAFMILKPCMDITQDELDKSMLVCVTVPILLSQLVSKKLQERGQGGAIVNISTAATQTRFPFCGPYNIVKSALESATKNFAQELAPQRIRVNCLLPGSTKTAFVPQDVDRTFLNSLTKRIPMGRMAEAEEIAHTVAYLLSDKSSYITGQCIASDGGFTIG